MSNERLAFTFHKCLGAGGFGEVYLASQHTKGGLQRLVAIKVLRDTFDDDDDAVKRLRDEGQILAMLAHPAILAVHQFTRIEGRLALVTEYVEGVDVATCCEPGKLMPPRAVLGVVAEIASALDWAWQTPNPTTGRPLQLIHRDIKPENIRISHHGQVKLLDFGIARTTEMTRQAKTAAGDVLLTPGYGAPEALAYGVSGRPVDVYALGISMFRMLTGERFFMSKPIAFQLSLALDTADYSEFLEERLALIPIPELQTLCAEMLRHTPERRPWAADITDRCEALSLTLEGPTYREWVRHYDFDTAESQADGPLSGKVITASGLLHMADAPEATPAPPPTSPAPPPEPSAAPPTPPPAFTGASINPSLVPPPDATFREPVALPAPPARKRRRKKRPAMPTAPAPQAPAPTPASRMPLLLGLIFLVCALLLVVVVALIGVLALAL